MRDIKFRAWHKNINCMCQNVKTDLLDRDYLECMQYTGLKDKNDKEIYEGDIIKLTYADKKTVFECIIKYVEDCAYYMLEDIKDSDNLDTFCGFSNEQFEIIGNIYENPELLEGCL